MQAQEQTCAVTRSSLIQTVTVGFGITPNHALQLVGCTTGGELHPALKILIQLKQVYASRARLSMFFRRG